MVATNENSRFKGTVGFTNKGGNKSQADILVGFQLLNYLTAENYQQYGSK
jgi:hypothetical protein